MELLLNLFWLLLAMIALATAWMAGCARGMSRWHRSVLLGCISLLVFPIVSASDDLRAMAMECEDSTVSKPGSAKYAKSHGSNCQNDATASPGAHASQLVPPLKESGNLAEECAGQFPIQGSATPMACRPPPVPSPLVPVAAVAVATQHRLGAPSPSSIGGGAHASAQKQRCLNRGERHGEHGVTNRADDSGDPLKI